MKRPTQPPVGTGSIMDGELLTLRELSRRLSLGAAGLRRAQRDGLRTISYGSRKYAMGRDVIAFFDGLATENTGNENSR